MCGFETDGLGLFTPLEAQALIPGMVETDTIPTCGRQELFIEDEVKALPFLLGFIAQHCRLRFGAGAKPPHPPKTVRDNRC